MAVICTSAFQVAALVDSTRRVGVSRKRGLALKRARQASDSPQYGHFSGFEKTPTRLCSNQHDLKDSSLSSLKVANFTSYPFGIHFPDLSISPVPVLETASDTDGTVECRLS